jgi:hypothetical protein
MSLARGPQPTSPGPDPLPVPRRGWAAVASVATGSLTLVTSEFLPVGLLTSVATDLHVSDGTAGTMVTTPGLVAALTAALSIPLLRFATRIHTAPSTQPASSLGAGPAPDESATDDLSPSTTARGETPHDR